MLFYLVLSFHFLRTASHTYKTAYSHINSYYPLSLLFPLVSYFLMRFELRVIWSTKGWEVCSCCALGIRHTHIIQQMALTCRQVDRLILEDK